MSISGGRRDHKWGQPHVIEQSTSCWAAALHMGQLPCLGVHCFGNGPYASEYALLPLGSRPPSYKYPSQCLSHNSWLQYSFYTSPAAPAVPIAKGSCSGAASG